MPAIRAHSIDNSKHTQELTPTTRRISRAKKGKRVHDCPHPGCTKVFTRAEHLRRHQLNHATEVLYRCELCQRTFVRPDLLARHSERHESQAIKAVHTLALAHRHGQFPNGFSGPEVDQMGTPRSAYDSNLFDEPAASQAFFSDLNMLTSAPGPAPQFTHPFLPRVPEKSTFEGGMGIPEHGFYSYSSSSPHSSNSSHRGSQDSFAPSSISDASILFGHVDQLNADLDMNSVVNASGLPVANSWISWDQYDWLFGSNQGQPSFGAQGVTSTSPPPPHLYAPNMLDSYQSAVGMSFEPENRNIGEKSRHRIFVVLADIPGIQESPFMNLDQLQKYFENYWTIFNQQMKIHHRASFIPDQQQALLVSAMVALGAAYESKESLAFAINVHDTLRSYLVNDGFPPQAPLWMLQTVLLIELFGKTFAKETSFKISQLFDNTLIKLLRQNDCKTVQPLKRVKKLLKEGREFHVEEEWRSWIELEQKKRIAIHSFLWDVTQAGFFGQDLCQSAFDLKVSFCCEDHIWTCDNAQAWLRLVEKQEEERSFLDTLRLFLSPSPQLPRMDLDSQLMILQGIVSIGVDLRNRSKLNDSLTQREIEVKKDRVLLSLSTWKLNFDGTLGKTLPQTLLDRAMALYHSAHLIISTDIDDLLIVAGESVNLGHSISRSSYLSAHRRLTQWANSPQATRAVWHAVQLLIRLLINLPGVADRQITTPWLLYLSTLACHSFGSLSAPLPDDDVPDEVIWDAQQDMRAFLHQMGGAPQWESLSGIRGRRRTVGLIAVVTKELKAEQRPGIIADAVQVLERINGSRTVKSV